MIEEPLKTINLPEFQVHAPANNVVMPPDKLPAGIDPTSAPVPNVGNDGKSFTPAALSLVMAAIQVGANIWTTYKQHEWQLDYMDKAQKQALERWAKENAYNDPKAVMKRLTGAGLNPNLVYGQAGVGTAGSANATAPPEAYVNNPMNGVSGLIQAAQQMQLTQSQIELNEANAERAHSDASKNKSDVQIAFEKLSLEQQKVADDILRNSHLNNLTDEQIEGVKMSIIESVARCEKIGHEIGLLDAEAAAARADAALKDVQASTWRAESNARIRELCTRAGMNEKLAEKYAEDVTDMVATRSYRIAHIIQQNKESAKREQLIIKEMEQMQQEINRGTQDFLRRKSFEDMNLMEKYSSVGMYAIDFGTSQIAKMFSIHLGMGSYKSVQQNFNHTDKGTFVPTSSLSNW